MSRGPVLRGAGFTARQVRIGRAELGLDRAWTEVDPFAVPGHPFGGVPVLEDDA